MLTDLNELPVSLDGPEAVAHWNGVQQGFLAHGARTGDHLAALLAGSPDFALGHAAQGLFYVLLGRSELHPAAARAMAAAIRAGTGAHDARTAVYVAALRDALGGHLRRTADRLDAWLVTTPRDALAMKLVQAYRFLLGDAHGMRRSVQGVDPHWADHPMRGYLLGCQAFTLEETGDYAAAEAAGRAGLDLAPDDAWGLHAVAHVYDMTGRAADGVRWLAGRSSHWAHCNNFRFHVWWHLALFHIDRGAFGPALALYDRNVRPTPTDDFRDIANAASLLLRLECEGVGVGERWEELADLAAGRVEDGALVFADLHYQMALTRAGRVEAADALALRLARDATGIAHDQHEVAGRCGAPIAEGLLHLRDGDDQGALMRLRRGLVDLPSIGGSHAQRDVFVRLAVTAALRAGNLDAAEDLLSHRALLRSGTDGYMQRTMTLIEQRRQEMRTAGLAAQ